MALNRLLAIFDAPDISEAVLADLRAMAGRDLGGIKGAADGKAHQTTTGVSVVPKRGEGVRLADFLSDEIIG